MLGWAHFRFRQRLMSKAEETGVHVIIQDEAYTSKTCSWCGNVQAIGGSKVYNCRGCNISIDRDENGARGIFLRALLDGALILMKEMIAMLSICLLSMYYNPSVAMLEILLQCYLSSNVHARKLQDDKKFDSVRS